MDYVRTHGFWSLAEIDEALAQWTVCDDNGQDSGELLDAGGGMATHARG